MIYHGVADGTFSPEDTARWYDGAQNASPDAAASFARLYLVPGMNHCGAGPAADQFDLLTPLVQWVEQGKAPAGLISSVRSNGNPGGANVDVPSAWSSNRTRPLCEYPKTSECSGVGSIEAARSFICKQNNPDSLNRHVSVDISGSGRVTATRECGFNKTVMAWNPAWELRKFHAANRNASSVMRPTSQPVYRAFKVAGCVST